MAVTLPGSPITVFSSAARTASATSDPYRIQGDNYRGLLLVINCTAVTSTPSVTFTIQSQTASADWSAQLVSSAVTSANTTTLIVAHPDAPDRANVSENTQIGKAWRVVATHADSDSITYSVLAYPLV